MNYIYIHIYINIEFISGPIDWRIMKIDWSWEYLWD